MCVCVCSVFALTWLVSIRIALAVCAGCINELDYYRRVSLSFGVHHQHTTPVNACWQTAIKPNEREYTFFMLHTFIRGVMKEKHTYFVRTHVTEKL